MADENNNPTEGSNEAIREENKLLKDKADRLLEIERLQTKLNKATGDEKKLLEAKIGLQQAIIAGDEEIIKIFTKRVAELEAAIEAETEAKKESIKTQKELNETFKAATELGKSFGKSIFELDSVLLKAFGSAGRSKEAFNAFAEGMQKAAEESSVLLVGLDSGITAIKKLGSTTFGAVLSLDSSAASFVQATGASREFALSAYETRNSLGLLGITGEEAVETAKQLYLGFNEFSQLSRASQQDFVTLSAQLEKIGGDAAGMAQTFTKVAGMSLGETRTAMLEVAGASEALGIPFSQVSQDLIGMGELFAKMGSAGLEVFLELEAAAKATGLSVQELYGIVDQYDTFENANQAAGRLNMVLGGNLLNTYDLLAASEEERIALLQEAMAQSGATFDDMDRYQKLEIANALNISLEQATKLFQTTRGEVEKTAAELMHAGMSTEELAERTKDAATAQEKFNVLMGNFAILVGPIVELLNKMIDGLLSLSETIGSTGAAAIFVFGSIAFSMAKAAAAAAFFGLRMRIAARVAGTAGTQMAAGMNSAGNAAANSINSVGKAAAVNAGGILALGAAVALVGIGFGAAAYGASFLVEQFKDMEPGQIMATSLAFIALAAGLALLTYTLVSMANPLTLTGILVLAGLLTVLIISGFAAANAVGRIVNKINEIDTTKISSLAAALSSIVKIAGMSLGGTGIPRFIKDVAGALDELPDNTEKMIAFSTTADSLSNLMQIGSSVEAEQLERIKMIIDGISNAEGNEATGRLADAINALVRGQAESEGTPITINLDGRVLGRWMEDYDRKRYRQVIAR